MHVLVTGGAGYIGSHTAKALAAAGHLPVVVDSLERGHRDAVRWGPLVEASLADRDALRRVFAVYAVGAVVHFAAYIAVGESVSQAGRYLRNNFVSTLNLLEAMQESGVSRIVFSSTAAVYGVPGQVPIPEDHPKEPVSPYGESKLMGERALSWFAACHGFSAACLRYFNAAGADPDGEIGERHEPETHLIPLALDAALGKRPPLELYGTDYPTPDGTAVRDYVHVTDLATAHLLALDYLGARPGFAAFNVGTGRGATVREVLTAIERVTGRPTPALECGRRAGDSPVLVADPRKAFSELGWRPRLSSLETIVETAFRWHASR